ncbi:glycosyltransferase family 2 protein [Myroides odoratimimus]|uniref:glycosyltransferase family 2 protein n=1 Tax=Myroides odoratimimus TaxID=76832 RepID=UPI0031010A68
MTPKVSIIVPVYNGEKYIKRAVDSLLNQNLLELEIIIVNDGSTDRTLEVLSDIKDERLRIISKNNEGVSIARNIGISLALGEYIGFVDADDYVKYDMYSTLYNNAKECDVVSSYLNIERDGKYIQKESILKDNFTYSRDSFANEILPVYLSIEVIDLLSVVNKLYRRSFLEDNYILFDGELSLEEDGMFNLNVFTRMSSIKNISYAGYFYSDNQSSVTRDFIKSNVFKELIKKYEYNYKSFFDLNFTEDELIRFKSARLIYSVCFLIYRMSDIRITLKEKNNYIKMIVENITVQKAVGQLDKEYFSRASKFERIVVHNIRFKNVIILNTIVLILFFLKKIGLIELIRKLN